MTEPTLTLAAVDALRQQFLTSLGAAETPARLSTLKDEFLGRKAGLVTVLLKGLGSLTPDQKRELGPLVNALKREIEAGLADRRSAIDEARPAGAVDVTLPERELPLGRIHPLMRVRQQVEDIFMRMGYEILEGPEVEDDFHNFEALNMPPDHPARDMQDTLYLDAPIVGSTWGAHRVPGAPAAQVRAATLLRTHTSAMQIRYMKTFPPPVRIIVPGRVYRRDNLDLSHTPMFQQFEGLVVGEGVTLADLKGTFEAMMSELFGDVRVRLRPSFFPYTEPSAEVDISCQSCGGDGCGTCKHTGWLEILGSGMVHPAVFEAVGYDPEQVSGFAFGMGLERVAMLKYGVDDIRLFYENDLRFLEQFPPL